MASISNKNNTAPLQSQLLNGTLPGNLVGARLGDDEGAGFGWEDQNIIKLGVKYQYTNTLAFMAGWNHGKAPIPEDQNAFNVLAPATVEDHLTMGLDWTLGNQAKVTVQYMHAFENEIKGDRGQFTNQGPTTPGAYIPTGPNPMTDSSAADLNMSQDSIAVSYSVNF